MLPRYLQIKLNHQTPIIQGQLRPCRFKRKRYRVKISYSGARISLLLWDIEDICILLAEIVSVNTGLSLSRSRYLPGQDSG